MERAEELTAIEAFLRTHKRTRCPTAVVVPTQGARVSEADLKAIEIYSATLEAQRKKIAKGHMPPGKQREHKEFEAFAVRIAHIIRELRQEGASLSATATTLNERGIKSFRGGTWHASTITTVLELADKIALASTLGDEASDEA